MTQHYESLSKSQLWLLVKQHNIAGLSWQSSKTDMVRALSETKIVDSGGDTLSGTLVNDVAKLNLPKVDVITEPQIANTPCIATTSNETLATDTSELNIPKVDVITNPQDLDPTNTLSNTTLSNPQPQADFSLWDEILSETGISIYSQTKPASGQPQTIKDITEIQKSKTTKESVATNTSSHITRTQIFTWSYLDHEMSGSWKPLNDETEKNKYIEFLEALNKYLEANKAKTFLVHNCSVSIKMKPRIIVEEDVNGRKLNRIDRSHQKNNLYANRNRTLMSTQEIAGRNIGEASVKASTLFQRSRYIAQPIETSEGWNFEGIDTIAVNGHQVYPVSVSTAIDESSVPDSQVPDAILKRRNMLAEKRVEARDFIHTRAKINNGLSPSFKDGNKLFCFQVDSNNRVSLWLLANDAGHTVSASDLVKGRKMYDVGYVEVTPYTSKEFVNVTMDMMRNGQEARLERFDWIRKQMNRQWLPTDEAIRNFLTQLKNAKGEALVITNLQVNNGVVTGELYGSKLIIRKREVTKHKVVFHPVGQSGYKADKNIEAFKRVQACAQTWLFSISPSTLTDLKVEQAGIKHRDAVLGLQNVRTRRTSAANDNSKVTFRNYKDRKYIIKLLTQFTEQGIYSDRERSDYLGKLVKTDGSSLTKEQIGDIADAVMANYPPEQRLATLFTPSHSNNVDEWQFLFLKLLKLYAGVTVSILRDGKLINHKSSNEVLEDYANGIYNYLLSMNKEVDTLTLGDAVELLKNSPSSPYKEVLLKVPNVARLNSHMSLAILTGKDKQIVNELAQKHVNELMALDTERQKLKTINEAKQARIKAASEALK